MVTAGGAQDAPDGGLDVRVELPASLERHDFVPRAKTGFQVKRPDMPREKILTEMRTGDHLRPVISELEAVDGAYIIVSAQGLVADGPLADRRSAMRDAIADDPNQARLHTDFYDRERVATWCNEYVGAAAFVRARTGHDLSGWRSIGRWSDTGVAVDGGYPPGVRHIARRLSEDSAAKALMIEAIMARLWAARRRYGGQRSIRRGRTKPLVRRRARSSVLARSEPSDAL